MIVKEIFITNDHQQSSLCQQNISCSQLSLKNHHCHRSLLLTTIRKFTTCSWKFVSVSFQSKQLTLPAYGISSATLRVLRGKMFKFEIWSCWSTQPPRWLWPHRSAWRHLCSAALFWWHILSMMNWSCVGAFPIMEEGAREEGSSHLQQECKIWLIAWWYYVTYRDNKKQRRITKARM